MQSHHRRRYSKSILLPRLSATNGTCNTTTSPINGQPNYARRMTLHLPETIPDNTYLYGYALLGCTFLVFITSVYAIIGSKYMPDTHNKVKMASD
jgi:hypothetical protein